MQTADALKTAPDFIPAQNQPDFIPFEDHSQPKSDTGVFSTLGRELKAGYESVKSIPSSLYHAAKDPLTAEEKNEYEGTARPEGPHGPAGRLLNRMLYKPVANASEYWWDAAHGDKPDAYEDSLAVAPEAMGGGAGALVAGEAVPKLPGAMKAVPRLAGRATEAVRRVLPDTADLAVKGKALGGLAAQEAFSRIPVAGRIVRRPSFGDFFEAAQKKALYYPKTPAGPSMESGNFSPIEGEYLPPDAPKALSAGIRRPVADASFPAPQAKPAPYRYGPGAIEPEDVAPPDPFVLGRRQGVRVQPSGPMRSLPAAPPEAEPFGVSRSEKFEPAERPDALDDKAWQEHMRDDLANHGARVRREQSANFREGNDVSKPKWEMQAEAKAAVERQRILDEARRTHDNPLAGLPRVTSRTKAPSGEAPVTTPDGEILNTLRESVKKAKAEKKK